MIILKGIAAMLVILGISVYTASFGIWTWKRENKYGAIMIFILVLITLILPVYTLFIRE